ncbi:MAG: DHH family phosphoesterase [Acidobacteriota bacterium]
MITEATRERLAALSAFVESKPTRGRWLVMTHDNPDPDALAASAALTLLLRRAFGRRAEIGYGGIIGRAENREMVRALGLDLVHVRGLNWRSYQHFALVDTQPRTGNNQLPPELQPDLVFDHHPQRKASYQAGFSDIRRTYGATATLLAEYLLAAGVPIPRTIATALVYAIRTETQDFSRGPSEGPDKEIYDTLLPHADKGRLARILYPRLPLGYYRDLQCALANLEGVGTLVISHLDGLEQPDIVPEIADLLLRMEGKTWSLCTGSYHDRVYLSIRTSNPRAEAGSIMRRLLGKRGKGGGHGMIAGGWVPIEKAPGGDVRALQRQLAARLARALKKNPERIEPLRLEPGAAPSSNGRLAIVAG